MISLPIKALTFFGAIPDKLAFGAFVKILWIKRLQASIARLRLKTPLEILFF